MTGRAKHVFTNDVYEVYTTDNAPSYLYMFLANEKQIPKHHHYYALIFINGESFIGVGLSEHSAKLACREGIKVNFSPELIPKVKKRRTRRR